MILMETNSGSLYAIKGENGEMIPVHYDGFNNEYVVMTAEEVAELPIITRLSCSSRM